MKTRLKTVSRITGTSGLLLIVYAWYELGRIGMMADANQASGAPTAGDIALIVLGVVLLATALVLGVYSKSLKRGDILTAIAAFLFIALLSALLGLAGLVMGVLGFCWYIVFLQKSKKV